MILFAAGQSFRKRRRTVAAAGEGPVIFDRPGQDWSSLPTADLKTGSIGDRSETVRLTDLIKSLSYHVTLSVTTFFPTPRGASIIEVAKPLQPTSPN